jgi:CSLREA domain-containing protein
VRLDARTLIVGALACVPLASAASAAAATLKVDTTRDELAARDGRCSLREAITAVEAPGRRTDCGRSGRTANTIILRAGRYMLTIAPVGADDNTSGDLNLTGAPPLTIVGGGTSATEIDASMLGDRVLSIASGAGLTLRSLRITGGRPPEPKPGLPGLADASCAATGAGASGEDAGAAGEGGGIFNSGTLVLDRVAVIGNRAAAGGSGGAGGSQSTGGGCGGGNGGQGGSGGGVYNRGSLTVTNSTIRGNWAGAGGAGGAGGGGGAFGSGGSGGAGGAGDNGGGLYNLGRLSVIGSTIHANRGSSGGAGGPGGAGIGSPGVDGHGGPGSWGAGIYTGGGKLSVTDSTLVGNSAGAGGAGGGITGPGGSGGAGGAVAAVASSATLRNVTVADDGVGAGGSSTAAAGAPGTGGGLFVDSARAADEMRLQNTIVASSTGSGCASSAASAIANRGHDLSYGDGSCPGGRGNPELGPLQDNGGPTWTMALGARSAAIDRVPRRHAGCPAIDQRGVDRPQGRACDIGAYEFATPAITITSPSPHASYQRGTRVVARFRCDEGGVRSAIASCKGSVAGGHAIGTGRLGNARFVVTAIDKSGRRARRSVRYFVFQYVNPVREVSALAPRRIDLGVDYSGFGPLLALGDGVVTMATDSDSGPSSCWAISCWPGGGIVVYRLLDGPFAGKYMYAAEHVTVTVHPGQRIRAGQQIATLYQGYPWVEFGWAAGPGPEALGIADGHQCTCGDPGGWSTIDGRNMDQLLVGLGAPSGWLQATPDQSMPPGWPSWPG